MRTTPCRPTRPFSANPPITPAFSNRLVAVREDGVDIRFGSDLNPKERQHHSSELLMRGMKEARARVERERGRAEPTFRFLNVFTPALFSLSALGNMWAAHQGWVETMRKTESDFDVVGTELTLVPKNQTRYKESDWSFREGKALPQKKVEPGTKALLLDYEMRSKAGREFDQLSGIRRFGYLAVRVPPSYYLWWVGSAAGFAGTFIGVGAQLALSLKKHKSIETLVAEEMLKILHKTLKETPDDGSPEYTAFKNALANMIDGQQTVLDEERKREAERNPRNGWERFADPLLDRLSERRLDAGIRFSNAITPLLLMMSGIGNMGAAHQGFREARQGYLDGLNRRLTELMFVDPDAKNVRWSDKQFKVGKELPPKFRDPNDPEAGLVDATLRSQEGRSFDRLSPDAQEAYLFHKVPASYKGWWLGSLAGLVGATGALGTQALQNRQKRLSPKAMAARDIREILTRQLSAMPAELSPDLAQTRKVMASLRDGFRDMEERETLYMAPRGALESFTDRWERTTGQAGDWLAQSVPAVSAVNALGTLTPTLLLLSAMGNMAGAHQGLMEARQAVEASFYRVGTEYLFPQPGTPLTPSAWDFANEGERLPKYRDPDDPPAVLMDYELINKDGLRYEKLSGLLKEAFLYKRVPPSYYLWWMGSITGLLGAGIALGVQATQSGKAGRSAEAIVADEMTRILRHTQEKTRQLYGEKAQAANAVLDNLISSFQTAKDSSPEPATA